MSDNYDDYEDQNENGPRALRENRDKLQKELTELRKKFEAMEAEKATLAAQVKKSSLADLLKQAGVDPKFAVRADKDGADASEAGVKAWIDENKDFYNFGQAKPAEVVEPDGEPNIPAGLEAGVRADQALAEAGVAPSEVDIASKIQGLAAPRSEAQLLEELQALGVKVTQGY